MMSNGHDIDDINRNKTATVMVTSVPSYTKEP